MSLTRHAVAALTLALLLPNAAQAQGRPAQPGTLIAAVPMAGAPGGARAWRIRYVSTGVAGRPEEVTGFVVAPASRAARPLPVLAWAHGTWGVAEACAPSRSANVFAVTPGLELAMGRGIAVVATDYAGLGTSQPHPYLVGDVSARNVLDAVRAARMIPRLALDRRMVVWGESQGGHSALFTGEIARRYAPDLQLVGVAAAAPPTDLVANLGAGGDPRVRAFLTAYVADSWSRALGAPVAKLGNAATQRLITSLAKGCVVIGKPPKLLTSLGILSLSKRLKTVDISRIEPWGGIARRNSAGLRPQSAPMLIVQSEKDQIVSPAVTRAYVRQQCRAGATISFISLATGEGHATTGKDSAEQTLNWIGARFAGKPPANSCGLMRN